MNSKIKLGIGSKFEGEIVGSASITLGDMSYVGPGVRIVGTGHVSFGDYCKVHSGCFINSGDGKFVTFGHNCWIGERSVLDGTGGLLAGNNVGVGIASHLYSHISHGDIIGGCRYHSSRQLTIEDDVWFVGQCLVSPVSARQKSVALLGSVITDDMDSNSVYAGVPAKDITSKVGQPWVDRPPQERLQMLREFISLYESLGEDELTSAESIVACVEYPKTMVDSVTYLNVMTRTYTKRSTDCERKFMNWFTSYKGRFIPA